jgi:hypothetical protein
VVENLIQTRVPMAMPEDLKAEISGLKVSFKAATNLVEKLESKVGRQGENIVKLQQEVKALKK